MRLELITTGTELLLGNTLNTHATFLGEHLLRFGLRIQRQLSIPDGDVIRAALLEAFPRCEILIVTGGLGPTSDDITREITAELLGLPLKENAAVLAKIQTYLARRKKELNDHTRRQAQVPASAVVLENDFGTAPGLYFAPREVPGHPNLRSPHLFLLPGPPRELRPMFQNQMAQHLREICLGKTHVAEMKNFRLTGLGESEVSKTVEAALRQIGADLEIGYCARPGEVIVRCIGTPAQLEAARMTIAAAFPKNYFSDDDSELHETLVKLMLKLGRTLATAESCTGGLIAHRITNVPGASDVLVAGYVTYANEAKMDLLGVPPDMLQTHGAVSAEVCQAMAEGALRRAGTHYAVAVTGIAGPGGGSPDKPVGTVFVGVAANDGKPTTVLKLFHPFDRLMFKDMTAQAALDAVRRRLMGL